MHAPRTGTNRKWSSLIVETDDMPGEYPDAFDMIAPVESILCGPTTGPCAPVDELNARAEAALLTAEQLAAFLGVDLRRLDNLDIPRVRLSNSQYRWDSTDVLVWLRRRRVPR